MIIDYDFHNIIMEMHTKKVKQQVMTRAYRVLLASRIANSLNIEEYKIKWADFEMIRQAVVNSAVTLPNYIDNYHYNREDKRFEVYSEEDAEWYLISDPDLAFREIVPNLIWPEHFNLTGIDLQIFNSKRQVIFRDLPAFNSSASIFYIPTMHYLNATSLLSFEPNINYALIQLEARLGLDIHTDEHALTEAYFAETLKSDPEAMALQIKPTTNVNEGLCLKYDTVNGRYYYVFNGLTYNLNGHPDNNIGNGALIY